MKAFGAAFLSVAFIGLACFALLSLLGLSEQLATSIPTIFIGAFPYIHQELLKRIKSPDNATLSPDRVVSPGGFALPWYLMLAYGTAILLAVNQLFGLPVIVLALSGGWQPGDVVFAYSNGGATAAALFPLCSAALSYAVARWIGMRCDRWGLAVALGSVVLGLGLMGLLAFSAYKLAVPYGTLSSYMQAMGTHLENLILPVVLPLGAAATGHWRGDRARSSAYFEHVLTILPAESRATVEQLVLEEATREGIRMAGSASEEPPGLSAGVMPH